MKIGLILFIGGVNYAILTTALACTGFNSLNLSFTHTHTCTCSVAIFFCPATNLHISDEMTKLTSRTTHCAFFLSTLSDLQWWTCLMSMLTMNCTWDFETCSIQHVRIVYGEMRTKIVNFALKMWKFGYIPMEAKNW